MDGVSEEAKGREGRIANVTGAVLLVDTPSVADESPHGADLERLTGLLGSFLEEVHVVSEPLDLPGPPCELRSLVAALAAAASERVLVVSGGRAGVETVPAALLLALVAWPESDAVVPRADGEREPPCGIYRREPVLAAAQEQLAKGSRTISELLDSVGASEIRGRDLAMLRVRP